MPGDLGARSADLGDRLNFTVTGGVLGTSRDFCITPESFGGTLDDLSGGAPGDGVSSGDFGAATVHLGNGSVDFCDPSTEI